MNEGHDPRMNEGHAPRTRTLARLVVAGALFALAYGTVSGSAPLWPDAKVYAVAAAAVGVLWAIAAISDDRHWIEVADAGLLALGLIRGAGFTVDLIRTGSESYFAAIAAWAIVVALCARPLKRAR